MSRKKRKKVKPSDQVPKLEYKVLSLLNGNPLKRFTIKLIVKKLGFRSKVINNQVPGIVSKLAKEGKIAVTKYGSFQTNRKPEYLQGKVDHVSSRFAYVIIPGEEDVYIKARDMNFALHEDIVNVAVFPTKHGLKREGKIVEVLKRARTSLVGRLEMGRNYAFLIADNRKIHEDVFIPFDNINGAREGEKVIAEIVRWPSDTRNAEGKVIRVLGQAGENEAEIHSIMAEFGLPFEFPSEVEAEAERINDDISQEIRNRRDMRQTLTFTIDPFDAKDFDDALSLAILPNGNYEIGIHIADVTHYVKLDSRLEDEAYHRATSVYLVDRTIPMLPERLSNGLCSLRPNEDKLTFSAVFEMTTSGKVVNEWFGRTAIHSDRRFSYEEAQECIENGEGDFASELITLNELAKSLKAKRFKKGAVNFETEEVKFRLDENGKPLEIIPKIRQDAHKLIEEFMLLANRSVATWVYKRKKTRQKDTFVYRVHDSPDPEKIFDFARFAQKFGHNVDVNESNLSSSINALLKEIEGQPEENVLQTLAIRSMAKAVYTTDHRGHFGLAFEHYTHFTSPIRRYPDMMVHRLLQHYLDDLKAPAEEEFEEKCKHSSDREKRAADAERASIKYKQVEFMTGMIGEEFEGIISGVTEWGIYVELAATKTEGMIRLADLKDDYYEFDERSYKVRGMATGNEYTLGDNIKVKVKSTDIDKRTIDLEMLWN